MASLEDMQDPLRNVDSFISQTKDESAKNAAINDARALADAIYKLQQQSNFESVDNYNNSLDPTENMSTIEKLVAGFGKAISDTYEGTKQLIQDVGHLSGISRDSEAFMQRRRDADERSKIDAPLMNTGAGMTGNILGHVTTAVTPGAALKTLGAGASLANAPRVANALSKAGTSLVAPKTLPGAMALGGAYSGMQPVGVEDDRAMNAATGAAFSGAGQIAGRGLKSAWDGGKAFFRPLSEEGRKKSVGNILNYYASNADDAVRNIQNAPELVAGSRPTLAEAADDIGLNNFQRGIFSANPKVGAAITEQQASNNLARIDALNTVIKDDIARADAKAAANAVINPLRQVIKKSQVEVYPKAALSRVNALLNGANSKIKAIAPGLEEIKDNLLKKYPLDDRVKDVGKMLTDTINNPPKGAGRNMVNLRHVEAANEIIKQLKRGVIDEGEAWKQLGKIKTGYKPYQDLIKESRKILRSETRLETSPEMLYGIRKDIATKMASKDQSGSLVYKEVMRNLTSIQNSIDNAIKKQVPEYGAYLNETKRLLKPITQMDVAKKLLDTSKNADGKLSQAKYARNMSPEGMRRLIKSQTGFPRGKAETLYDPEQLKLLNNINLDLTRESAVNAGKPIGSPTAQNLSSMEIMRQIFGPFGASDKFMNSGLVRKIAAPVDIMNHLTREEMENLLKEAATNPRLAAELMQMAPSGGGPLSAPSRAAATYLPQGLLGSYLSE